MPFVPRQLIAAAAATVAVCAGAAPALARTSPTTVARAKPTLTAEIAAQTPSVDLGYQLRGGVDQNLEPNALACGWAASSVNRIHADSAQQPAKLEWVLGAYLQARGDNSIYYGEHEEVYGHASAGKHAIDAGLADFRLSNYYIGHADSLLGIRHPEYAAKPYQPYRDRPIRVTTPLIDKSPSESLAATIAMGTPVIDETLPEHIVNAYLYLNEAASNYYAVAVGRMHVDGAQRQAQLEWADGMRALDRGDEQLNRATEFGFRVTAAGKREIPSAFTTLRLANSDTSQADALLGIHQARPTVGLPTRLLYTY